MSWVERWLEGTTRRPAFQTARGLTAFFGTFWVISFAVHYLRGGEIWVGLAVAVVVAFTTAACALSLLRERRRADSSGT